MPSLLLFVPAERIIVDSETNNASLVNVIGDFSFDTNAKIGPDTAIPIQWRTLTAWRIRGPEEIGVWFEQAVRLYAPDGTQSLEAKTEFRFELPNHRVMTQFPMFPVGQPGEYWLKAFLRKRGGNEDWKLMGEYPISVSQAPI